MIIHLIIVFHSYSPIALLSQVTTAVFSLEKFSMIHNYMLMEVDGRGPHVIYDLFLRENINTTGVRCQLGQTVTY